MTETKANKALKKVTLNFTNNPASLVCSEDELVEIDITDQLPENYYLISATVDRGGTYTHTVEFMEKAWLKDIADEIDTILDATLVNAKQRESVGQLVKRAIWKERGRWSM